MKWVLKAEAVYADEYAEGGHPPWGAIGGYVAREFPPIVLFPRDALHFETKEEAVAYGVQLKITDPEWNEWILEAIACS